MTYSVVVGVDGSGPSDAALRWALHRAMRTGATLIIEHVIGNSWSDPTDRHEANEATTAGGRILADAIRTAQSISAAITPEVRLVRGRARFSLAQDSGPNDLLVVGTHKTGFIRGRVLGTRSMAIAAAAPCSVVVVPQDFVMLRSGVVAGITHVSSSNAAVRTAAAEASSLGQELSIVFAAPHHTYDSAEARAVLVRGVGLAHDVSPSLVIRSRHAVRGPVEALLDAGRHASLLVLGGGCDPGSFVGSICHEVLLNITCPVLLVRGGGPGGASAAPEDLRP